MADSILERRQLLKSIGAGALGAGALATLRPTSALAASSGNDGVGSWLVTITTTHQTFPGPVAPPFPGVLSFASGGTAAGVDALERGTGLGSWERHGDGLAFTIVNFAHKPNGDPDGWARVDGHGTIENNSIHGHFKVTVFDPSGTEIGTASGTLKGHHLDVHGV